MLRIAIIIIAIASAIPAWCGILINEVSAGGPVDWVEIRATEDLPATDISSLFITMYYGSNEKLALSPVTIYGRDIPGTTWDDRFAVIHFSSSGEADETDAAGDLNKNGVRDLYCNNYGLWNTDCVVAIDSDDEPKNGGILDFAAFSNRDGSVNSTIAGYIKSASDSGQWISCASVNVQECMCFIGEEGMNSYSTLSRKEGPDSNSQEDFVLTPYATPGRENIISPGSGHRKTAEPISDRIVYTHGSSTGIITLRMFIYRECSIRFRIFNSAGTSLYSSNLIRDVTPGYFNYGIREDELKGRILTGLYPVKIEVYSDGKTDKSTVYLVIIRR